MTNSTIRERLEDGSIEQHWIDYFLKYKGHAPLCCHEAKKKEDEGEWKITCSWLKEWFPEKEFKKKCLACQKIIEKKLKKKGMIK